MLRDEPCERTRSAGPRDAEEVDLAGPLSACRFDRRGFLVAGGSSGCPEPERHRSPGEGCRTKFSAADEGRSELQHLRDAGLAGHRRRRGDAGLAGRRRRRARRGAVRPTPRSQRNRRHDAQHDQDSWRPARFPVRSSSHEKIMPSLPSHPTAAGLRGCPDSRFVVAQVCDEGCRVESRCGRAPWRLM